MTQPPEPELHGVRALVTGGTSGLGFAMSQALAEAGARVALTGRTEERVQDAATRIAHGTIGLFLVARAVVPHLLGAGYGKIINISVSDTTMRRRGFTPYGPSRAATEALSHIMAADLGGTGIDVNLLLPGGPTRSGMTPDDAPDEVQATWLDPAIREMVVSGRADMSPEPGPEALRHLVLRYAGALAVAQVFLDGGFDVVVEDVIIGPVLREFLGFVPVPEFHLVFRGMAPPQSAAADHGISPYSPRVAPSVAGRSATRVTGGIGVAPATAAGQG